MRKLLRRALTTGVGAVAVLAIGMGQASAHFCFKEELNERAAQGMARSANWVAFGDLAAEITGLCPAGVQVLADAAGVSTSTLINSHGLMAGGTLKKGEPGNPAIGHLNFEAIEAAEGDAIAACS